MAYEDSSLTMKTSDDVYVDMKRFFFLAVGAAEVQLVAVSKFQSKEAILEAYAAGQRVFGENYVQVSVSLTFVHVRALVRE
jgi:hypothetical protein